MIGPVDEVEIPLTPDQQDIANHPARIKVLVGGRRWGKSTLLQAVATQNALKYPTEKSLFLMPILSTVKEFYQDMMDADGFSDLLAREPTVWPAPIMTFHGGHRLFFKSFERPDRIRSSYLRAAYCDEANQMSVSKILQVVLPKLADLRGTLWITSTITHHNELWDLYLRGQNPKEKLVKSWLRPSSTGYIFQSKEGQQELADLRSVTPKPIFDAEWDCVPGTDMTAAFPFFNQCIGGQKFERPRNCSHIMAVDLGRSVDNTAVVVMEVDTGLVVYTELFPLGLHTSLYAQKAGAIARFWNASVIVDSTGGGGSGGSRGTDDSFVLEYKKEIPDLREYFWSPNRDNDRKEDAIVSLMLATEQKKIQVPECFPELIQQMRAYSMIYRNGRRTFGPRKGSGVNDDLVSSLAMCWLAIRNGWYVTQSGAPLYVGIN